MALPSRLDPLACDHPDYLVTLNAWLDSHHETDKFEYSQMAECMTWTEWNQWCRDQTLTDDHGDFHG